MLFYTARTPCKGQMTIEEVIISLKQSLRFLDSELLGLQGLSWDLRVEAA